MQPFIQTIKSREQTNQKKYIKGSYFRYGFSLTNKLVAIVLLFHTVARDISFDIFGD